MTLTEIESLTKTYADAHQGLADVMRKLEDDVRRLKRERLPAIRRAVTRAAEAKTALKLGIETDTALFDKPRTRVFHGVKVGLQKGKGGLTWDDPQAVVERIERIYDDEIGTLVRTRKEPNKQALAELPAADLKKLGVTIVDAGDEVVIRPVDGDIDRLVDALMSDEEVVALAEAAA